MQSVVWHTVEPVYYCSNDILGCKVLFDIQLNLFTTVQTIYWGAKCCLTYSWTCFLLCKRNIGVQSVVWHTVEPVYYCSNDILGCKVLFDLQLNLFTTVQTIYWGAKCCLTYSWTCLLLFKRYIGGCKVLFDIQLNLFTTVQAIYWGAKCCLTYSWTCLLLFKRYIGVQSVVWHTAELVYYCSNDILGCKVLFGIQLNLFTTVQNVILGCKVLFDIQLNLFTAVQAKYWGAKSCLTYSWTCLLRFKRNIGVQSVVWHTVEPVYCCSSDILGCKVLFDIQLNLFATVQTIYWGAKCCLTYIEPVYYCSNDILGCKVLFDIQLNLFTTVQTIYWGAKCCLTYSWTCLLLFKRYIGVQSVVWHTVEPVYYCSNDILGCKVLFDIQLNLFSAVQAKYWGAKCCLTYSWTCLLLFKRYIGVQSFVWLTIEPVYYCSNDILGCKVLFDIHWTCLLLFKRYIGVQSVVWHTVKPVYYSSNDILGCKVLFDIQLNLFTTVQTIYWGAKCCLTYSWTCLLLFKRYIGVQSVVWHTVEPVFCCASEILGCKVLFDIQLNLFTTVQTIYWGAKCCLTYNWTCLLLFKRYIGVQSVVWHTVGPVYYCSNDILGGAKCCLTYSWTCLLLFKRYIGVQSVVWHTVEPVYCCSSDILGCKVLFDIQLNLFTTVQTIYWGAKCCLAYSWTCLLLFKRYIGVQSVVWHTVEPVYYCSNDILGCKVLFDIQLNLFTTVQVKYWGAKCCLAYSWTCLLLFKRYIGGAKCCLTYSWTCLLLFKRYIGVQSVVWHTIEPVYYCSNDILGCKVLFDIQLNLFTTVQTIYWGAKCCLTYGWTCFLLCKRNIGVQSVVWHTVEPVYCCSSEMLGCKELFDIQLNLFTAVQAKYWGANSCLTYSWTCLLLFKRYIGVQSVVWHTVEPVYSCSNDILGCKVLFDIQLNLFTTVQTIYWGAKCCLTYSWTCLLLFKRYIGVQSVVWHTVEPVYYCSNDILGCKALFDIQLNLFTAVQAKYWGAKRCLTYSWTCLLLFKRYIVVQSVVWHTVEPV